MEVHSLSGRQYGADRFGLEALSVGAEGEPPPTEIEVILSGTYKVRNLVVDDGMIDQMIANHLAAGVDPAIDQEHESWNTPPPPDQRARGWVKALSKRPARHVPGRTALVARVEWTDLGIAAIRGKHFRYVSAGLDLNAKNRLTGEPIGVKLDHVALVKNPFVEGMQPLALSVGGGFPVGPSSFEARLEVLERAAAVDKATAAAGRAELDGLLAAYVSAPDERQGFADFTAAVAADPQKWEALAAAQRPAPTPPKARRADPRDAAELAALRAIDEHMRRTGETFERTLFSFSEADHGFGRVSASPPAAALGAIGQTAPSHAAFSDAHGSAERRAIFDRAMQSRMKREAALEQARKAAEVDYPNLTKLEIQSMLVQVEPQLFERSDDEKAWDYLLQGELEREDGRTR